MKPTEKEIEAYEENHIRDVPKMVDTHKFWWEDAHLRMPKYEDILKIEEWEACYAALFSQMNIMSADFFELKDISKLQSSEIEKLKSDTMELLASLRSCSYRSREVDYPAVQSLVTKMELKYGRIT